LGVAFADYDGDRFTDIFVANHAIDQFLFRNNGNGRFTECGLNSGAALSENGKMPSGMGVVFQDCGNDGLPDLLITQLPHEPYAVFHNKGRGRTASALSSQSTARLLGEFPNSARGHQAMGQNYYAVKTYPQVEKEYQQALVLRPNLPGLPVELGQIYAANSEWQKAETQFRKEVKSQPGSAEAAYRLGDTLLQEGKMRGAVEQLSRSDRLRPDMSDTLHALGGAAALSDPALAERSLNRVVELEKDTPLAARTHLVLAEIHRKQGKTEQAAREMQEHRRMQPLASHFPG
jgi:tetratricopeptide (TPR) repeat protein